MTKYYKMYYIVIEDVLFIFINLDVVKLNIIIQVQCLCLFVNIFNAAPYE
jgi:hypothetical protein